MDHPSAEPREWWVGNGLGGYASGPVRGPLTRRYHGLLVAELPPWGRVVLLSALECPELGEPQAFSMELGLPCWRYQAGASVVERRLLLPHGENRALLRYRLLAGPPLRLTLEPWCWPRPHHARLDRPWDPALLQRLRLLGPGLRAWPRERAMQRYDEEARRGYDSLGPLHSPGVFEVRLGAEPVTLQATAEPGGAEPDAAWEAEIARRRALVLPGDDAATAALRCAADAFVAGRRVIAGYPWFTAWGRDTLISLEGLLLCNRRYGEAGAVLREVAAQVDRGAGLLPNSLAEGSGAPEYHSADASLWLFQALARALHHLPTQDERDALLADLLPALRAIVAAYRRGTDHGIAVDPADGLLRQGAPDLALTWMDARLIEADGACQVFTPRRGKAVELCALWYNALRLLAAWTGDADLEAEARRVHASFNARFPAPGGALYDVLDPPDGGYDDACRPNQLLALSLTHPVLAPRRWPAVLEAARRHLLTPYGLRTLAPAHPDYQGRCEGDARSRDRAYHQGTVWPWLLGPFIDAWRRAYPHAALPLAWDALDAHLHEQAALGSISEIFDGDAPHRPRGCPAQAWSVAEVLRVRLTGPCAPPAPRTADGARRRRAARGGGPSLCPP